jgi:TolB-like protein
MNLFNGTMVMKSFFLFFASAASLFAAAGTELPSIAVLDFQGRNISKEEALALTDRFASELTNTNKFKVMERERMNLILQEQEFQQTDCVDQACAVDIGQVIAVRKIVTGAVSKVGAIYTVNAKIIDVETGKIDTNVTEDCDCPIEKVLTQTMKRLAFIMAGLESGKAGPTIAIQRGDASLYIKSDPADASVYVNGTLMDGRTPLTLENLTAGKYVVMVKKTDMQAKKEVMLASNQVTRIALTLQKQKTMLKITSEPSEAEVYLVKRPGAGTKPDQITPAIFENLSPGTVSVTLFKIGFRDTTVPCLINANEINTYQIKLTGADPDYIKQQKKMVSARKQRKIGVWLSVSSLACGAVGGGLNYWAQKDFDEALTAKEFLDASDVRQGPEWDENLRINKEKTDSGNLKYQSGIGLLIAGGAGLAAGVTLYF